MKKPYSHRWVPKYFVMAVVFGRNLKEDIRQHHAERNRTKCLCDRMNNMPHIPGLILIQLLIIAIYDLCNICQYVMAIVKNEFQNTISYSFTFS